MSDREDRATTEANGQDPNAEGVQSPDRLAALKRTDLLDSAPEPVFDRLTALAQRVLGTPVTLMSLVDEDRQFFKSLQGLDEPWASRRETPLSHSFCQHVVGTNDALVIADAREHPLVRDNLAIADLGVAAYLGVPLITPDNRVLGSFCAIDTRPRAWSADDVANLADFAAVAAIEIASRKHLQERDQMRIVVEELDHRMRNLLTVIKIIAEQTGYKALSAREFLETFGSRLDCLAAAHSVLIESQYKSAGLRQIAQRSLATCFDRIELDVPDQKLDPAVATALALAFHELATNAVKYGALSVPEGSISLSAQQSAELPLLLVWREDGGPPTTPPDKTGFGLRMLDVCLASHGGAVDVDWQQAGLVCNLRLPAG